MSILWQDFQKSDLKTAMGQRCPYTHDVPIPHPLKLHPVDAFVGSNQLPRVFTLSGADG